jgi:hypothetical protein
MLANLRPAVVFQLFNIEQFPLPSPALSLAIVLGSVCSKRVKHSFAFTDERIALDAQLQKFVLFTDTGRIS